MSDVDIYINNKRVVEDNSFTDFDAYPSSSDLIIGKGDEDDSTAFFSGVIDEVRILNYQSMAFGGGLMISKVAGNFVGEGTITIFNAAGSTVDLTGVRLMKNSVSDLQCAALSGTLAAGATTTATCSSLNQDGMVYLADMDGDNDGSNEGSTDTKFWVIDAVCWNNGSGVVSSCDGASDAVIAAGLWAEDTYVNDASGEGVQLSTAGNNDQGVNDWEAIPEFGTLLMPIASVLLIVGYNYRRKETEA